MTFARCILEPTFPPFVQAFIENYDFEAPLGTPGAANEPSFSYFFLSWGPLGAEVVPKLSPRASLASIFFDFVVPDF